MAALSLQQVVEAKLAPGSVQKRTSWNSPCLHYEADAVWPVRTCCVSRPGARGAAALLSCWLGF